MSSSVVSEQRTVDRTQRSDGLILRTETEETEEERETKDETKETRL